MRRAACLLLLSTVSMLALHARQARAETYNVIPDVDLSSDSGDDVFSLAEALDIARAGDIIALADGHYVDQLHSRVPGEEGNPIIVTGGRSAVIKGESPCILIEHSWITLEGFTVDGRINDESIVNKCLEVDGMASLEGNGLHGFVMTDMKVQSCSEECVRLKNSVKNSEITDNEIEHCGVQDFVNDYEQNKVNDEDRNVNGEGIYIGTSMSQWSEEAGEDQCNDNLISGNTIATHGNECVVVKEGSSGNMIEDNVCSEQKDVKAGCYALKGDYNTFRNNAADGCKGAGLRLGGGENGGEQYGKNNNIYDNHFTGAEIGAIIVVRPMPQGIVCGNTCDDGPCDLDTKEDGDVAFEDTWDKPCSRGGDDDNDNGDDDQDGDDDDDRDFTDDDGDSNDDNADDGDDDDDDDDDVDDGDNDDGSGDDDDDGDDDGGDDDSKEGKDDDGDDYQ